MTGPRPTRASRAAWAVVFLVAALLAGCSHISVPFETLPCHTTAVGGDYALDTDQSVNAVTIAAVGKGMGLPDHAVTVALAAALQESKLYNLPYGDLDSLGLFQQRPSQGWGTDKQILDPRYAATAFYTHLTKVASWQTLAVSDAAQAVQHSAAADAYAKWESEARVLAQALTGEVPAGFTCRTGQSAPAPAPASGPGAPLPLSDALSAEVGGPVLGVPVDTGRGWLVSAWLVTHADRYGVKTVTFSGHRWTGRSGAWKPHPPADNAVQVQVQVRGGR